MNWAIDVLRPTSESSVWEKYVATSMLAVLAKDGQTDTIRKLSATVLANNAKVVS